MNTSFQFFWLYAQDWNCWACDHCMFQLFFFEGPPDCVPQPHHFTSPPAAQKDSSCSVSLPTLLFSGLYIYLSIWLHQVSVAACGIFSLWHARSPACGIQFPNQGSNPCPLYGEHGIPATGLPGKSLAFGFYSHGSGCDVYVSCPVVSDSLRPYGL